jgi:hypothetical protein
MIDVKGLGGLTVIVKHDDTIVLVIDLHPTRMEVVLPPEQARGLGTALHEAALMVERTSPTVQ